MSEQQADTVIVGGGLVGAALALALGRGQAAAPRRRIVLVESADIRPGDPSHIPSSPSFDTRATALAESSVASFRRLGVWESMANVAAPITHVHVSELGRWGATRLEAREMGRTEFGHVVLNSGIGQALLQGLARSPGVEVWSPATVRQLQPIAGGMRVIFDGARQAITAPLVVLADGGRSPLMAALGLEVTRLPYGQVAVIANLEPTLAADGRAFERFTGDGAMAILPLCAHQGRPRVALVWTRPAALAEATLSLDDAAFLAAVESRFGQRLGPLRWAGSRVVYPLERNLAREQARPGLVVLGNAAHTLHPVAGQGFNLSLRDAMALAAHLQELPETQSLGDLRHLQRFVDSRQQDQWATVLAGDVLLSLFGSRSPLLRRIRQAGLVSLELLPDLRRRIANLGMGLANQPRESLSAGE